MYSFFLKIVDDIHDNNLILDFKYLFVTILLLLTAYIIFLTKELGMCLSAGLIANGFMGMFHFYRIDIFPWKMSVLLGLIGFIYHFSYMKEFLYNLHKKDFILGAFLSLCVLCGGSSVVVAINEEYSKRKLIIRILAILLMFGILIYKKTLQKMMDISESVFNIVIWACWGGIGYLSVSILVMSYFLYFNIN